MIVQRVYTILLLMLNILHGLSLLYYHNRQGMGYLAVMMDFWYQPDKTYLVSVYSLFSIQVSISNNRRILS